MGKKLKHLVRWKEYIIKRNTWKKLENLGNIIELVEKFEKEIREKEIRRVQMRKQKPLNPKVERYLRKANY